MGWTDPPNRPISHRGDRSQDTEERRTSLRMRLAALGIHRSRDTTPRRADQTSFERSRLREAGRRRLVRAAPRGARPADGPGSRPKGLRFATASRFLLGIARRVVAPAPRLWPESRRRNRPRRPSPSSRPALLRSRFLWLGRLSVR
jgi:hypothetical protein